MSKKDKSETTQEVSAVQETPSIAVKKEWQRPDPLRVDGKDPSKAYRFVDKNKLEQRKYEGWKPVEAGTVGYANPDSEDNSGKVQYRELILCEMPKEKAEERNEFYRNKTQAATLAARENFRKKAEKAGVDFIENKPKSSKFYSFGR